MASGEERKVTTGFGVLYIHVVTLEQILVEREKILHASAIDIGQNSLNSKHHRSRMERRPE